MTTFFHSLSSEKGDTGVVNSSFSGAHFSDAFFWGLHQQASEPGPLPEASDWRRSPGKLALLGFVDLFLFSLEILDLYSNSH